MIHLSFLHLIFYTNVKKRIILYAFENKSVLRLGKLCLSTRIRGVIFVNFMACFFNSF